MFRAFVIAVAGFVVGATATYAVVLFGTLAAWQMLGVVDQDGGGSMGLTFVIAPLAALVGGIVTEIVTIVRVHRRLQGTQIGSDERQRGVSRFSLLGGVLVGGCAGYLIAKAAFWLAGPMRYVAMWKALLHTWAPLIIMLVGATVGGFIARRMSRT